MNLVKKQKFSFFKKFKAVLSRTGPVLFFVTMVSIFFEQLLTKSIELEMMGPAGVTLKVLSLISIFILFSLFIPLIITFLVTTSLFSESIVNAFKKSWQLMIIEGLRSTGKTILWSCLLIIPGLIRYVQYSFVQFIVLLDPDYNSGKKDALDESVKLVNKKFFKVVLIYLVFTFLLPLLLADFDEYIQFDAHPFWAIVYSVFETFIFILGTLFLIKQWENANGTHIQLKTN